MEILCNKSTSKVEGFLRHDNFNFNPATHVVVTVDKEVDDKLYRLNNTEDGVRLATQTEIDTEIEAEKDARVDAELGIAKIIIETLLPLINPSLDATDIMSQAKAKRKLEL